MVQAYFEDMELLLSALGSRANPNALLKIAVGTSAYAGVVVPVDFILAENRRESWLGIERCVGGAAAAQFCTELKNTKAYRDNNVPELRESIVVLRSPSK